jgi:hypothetical protein
VMRERFGDNESWVWATQYASYATNITRHSFATSSQLIELPNEFTLTRTQIKLYTSRPPRVMTSYNSSELRAMNYLSSANVNSLGVKV